MNEFVEDASVVEDIDETALPGAELEATAEAEAKPAKPKSPYAGLSGHQRNRRRALEKYGDPNDPRTTSGRNDFRLEFVDPDVRKRATEELTPANTRKDGKVVIGGDRYIGWVHKQGYPDGMLRVVWSEDYAAEMEARKAERERIREEVKAKREADKAAAKAAREEEKARKAAEKEAAEIAELEATIEVKPKKSKKAKAEEAE